MRPELRCLTILAACPLLLPFFHGACVRAARAAGLKAPAQGMTILAVLAGLPLALAACWHWSWTGLPREWLGPSAAYAGLVYLSFGYAYFHLYNMSETARRIRVLADFRRKGAMRAEDLALDYSSDHMLAVRLQRLVDLGQLRREGERYRIRGGALLFCARLVAAYGRLLDSSWSAPGASEGTRDYPRT